MVLLSYVNFITFSVLNICVIILFIYCIDVYTIIFKLVVIIVKLESCLLSPFLIFWLLVCVFFYLLYWLILCALGLF